MSNRDYHNQLPPTTTIQTNEILRANTENWFEYPIQVYPHHTDHGGIVWHGNYLTWMEEARVEYLKHIGMDYADLVNLGCELVVVEVNLKYHKSLTLGTSAIIKTRMNDIQGVRINNDYRIESIEGKDLYLTGKTTLVGIDREKRKIMRQLPPVLKDALIKL